MAEPVLGPWPRWITASYEQELGQPICSAEQLYAWPAVVLCHDTSDDPVLVFVNQAAQVLWERPWPQFVGMPSRLTAPAEERVSRATALSASGVVRGYAGVRVSASGRLFRIVDATVWPVVDDAGVVRGQAAAFTRAEPVGG